MNIVNWNRAFEELGAELVEMKLPMRQNGGAGAGWPIATAPRLTIAEERHLQPKVMTVHSMFGKFYCPNPKCKSKSWSSTSCNSDIKYRFDESKQCGEIVIVEEFGQQCKRCNRMVKPKFDLEATEKAMSKIIERIKKGRSFHI